MKLYIYLFLGLLLISPFISAVGYDDQIYVNPFVFGVLRGDDGTIINSINESDIQDAEMMQHTSIGFERLADLDLTIKNNKLLIFKIPQVERIKINTPNKFTFVYDTIDYPSKNVNILFRLN